MTLRICVCLVSLHPVKFGLHLNLAPGGRRSKRMRECNYGSIFVDRSQSNTSPFQVPSKITHGIFRLHICIEIPGINICSARVPNLVICGAGTMGLMTISMNP